MDLEQRKSYDVIISDYKHRIFKAYEGDTPDMIRFRATLETMKQPDMYEVDKQAKAIRPQGGNNWYDYAGDAIKGFGKSIGTIPGRVAMQAARGTMNLSTNFALTGQKLLNYGEMAAYGFASLFTNADPEIKAQEKKLQELSGLSKAYGQVSDDLNKQINASLGGNESIGTEIIDGIASVAPSFLISGGGAMLAKGADVVSRVAAGSRTLAFAYGMSGANEVASDLESRGVSRGQAFLTGVGAAPLIGYVNTLGDKLPLRTILAKGAERMGLVTVAKKMIQNGLSEGVEESADYATRKATQFLNGVNEESWLEIGQNFLKTFGMATLVGNVVEGGAIAFNQAGFVADTKKRLMDAGMTEERADLQIADWIEATQSDKFRQDLAGMNQILSSPELKEFQEQTLSQQRQAIISGLNGVLMQAEVIDMGQPTIDDPTRTPPVLPESYTLDGETVSTADNPILGMMLYQMEQEGKPITSLKEALRVVDEKVGLSETVKTAASIAQVYGQATQDLRMAGFSEEEIDSTARSQTAMAYSLARTLGVSVEEAYATFPKIQRSNSTEVRQIKPLAEADIDLLKIAKNPALYKRLEQQEKEQRGLSLLPFLKQRGGLKDTGGELKSMDAGKSYIGLINNKNGQELDNMALSAWENGYFPMHSERPTVDELLQAIDDELRGNKHYAHNQDVFGSKLEAVNGLIENMNQLNVGYENVSAEDALKEYNEAVKAYNSGNYQKNGVSWNYDESGNLYGTTADGKTIIDGEIVPFQEPLFYQKNIQNVVDLTDAFKKNPSIDDVKNFLDKVVKKGSSYATLSPDWLIDVKGGRKRKQHIAYSDIWNDMTHQEKKRHNKYVMAFEQIINNSIYSHTTKNKKLDLKPNIEKYHYFTSRVKIGDKIYDIVLDTEQYKGESEKKPQTVHLYNIKEVSPSNSKTAIKSKRETSRDNIAQSNTNVNTQPSQNNIYYQGQISDNGQGVELTINSQEEMQGLSDEEFKSKMLETLKSFKGNKIFNQSLNGDIEIRTSSIKKYKSFFADKNKRLIVPYIPELLEKAKFREIEKSYMQGKEPNIKAYYKASIGITIDNNDYNVRLTVREDNQGNFFWDAQVKEGSQHATPATNPGDTAPIDLIILQPDLNVKPLLQEGGTPNGAYDSGANIIYLFETANRSTFLHEMSHFYMNQILQAANAGSERAQAIKQALDKWLRKNGNESYSSADWERFARGFEQYLREGKTPNNYMKRAFDAFKQWLSSVYAALRGQRLGVINEVGNAEPVRMNDEIRSLYADMLGGKNIDEVLDKADSIRKQEQALREMHEQQERMAQERASMIDHMAETLLPNEGSVKSWLNNLRTDYKKSSILKDIFTSLTTRAKNIDPAIALQMREFVKSEYDLTNHFAQQVEPLMTKLRAMSIQDQQLFDFYAKNAHESGIDRLAGKYGFTQELEGYRHAMDEIYQMATEAGIEMNYREVYYPRRVKDKVAFLEYINNKDAGLISQMNDEIGMSASMDEKAEWLNAHLQSFHIEHFPKLPGNTNERTIDIIDPDLNRFYEHIFDSIANYIDGMAKAINMRRVWGKGADIQDGQMTKIGLEQTIGEVIARGVEKGTITTNAQMDEVRRILTAFLGDHGHQSQLLARIKGSSYVTMLTRGTATLSQIGDFGTSIWNNGLVNTIKALMPNEDININKLGIEKLTEEFRNPEAMAKQINWLYKISGFNDVDIYMKNVYLRGRWAKLKEMKTADLETYLRPMFENRTDDLIKDIKSGNVSDDVKLLLFSELSEVQPTSKAELPYAYAVNPNGRALYMMKTFMIRRMDFILQKTRGEWKKGNKAQAVKNLATLALVVGGFDALANLIKDIVRGKEVNLTDNVIDGILGMFMLNQYIMYRFRSGGVTDAAASLVIPPVFPALQTLLFRDLPKVLAGKRDIKDMEFWSYITALGNFYYWYFGGGLKKKDKTRGASGTIRF